MSLNLLSPQEWAQKNFGAVRLGDRRRTRRAVQTAARMLRHPAASLPAQMGTASALKAAYRLLAEEEVTYAALLTPHWAETRQAACASPLVLFIQDTTQLDYTHHPRTHGLGPIGAGRSQGLHLHTALAVLPQPRQVLGLAYQEPFLRQPAPRQEDCKTRRQRPRESQVWARTVQAIGAPPPGRQWVHVADAGADSFEFMATCRQKQVDFLVRVAQDRRVQDAHTPALLALVHTWPARGTGTVELPAREVLARPPVKGAPAKRPARVAQVQISFGPVTLLPPPQSAFREPLALWAVRVWEAAPPAEVADPVDWLLLTSVLTENLAAAWERPAWYKVRWLAEDYHRCLKTGCQVEQRQLQEGARLIRLLGFLAPVAVRLLQLRELARLQPEALARAVLPQDLVHVVAHLAELPPETLTMTKFWRAIAGLGGYLGRKRDGPPGWKTLWQGWLYVQAVLEGVRLAPSLPP